MSEFERQKPKHLLLVAQNVPQSPPLESEYDRAQVVTARLKDLDAKGGRTSFTSPKGKFDPNNVSLNEFFKGENIPLGGGRLFNGLEAQIKTAANDLIYIKLYDKSNSPIFKKYLTDNYCKTNEDGNLVLKDGVDLTKRITRVEVNGEYKYYLDKKVELGTDGAAIYKFAQDAGSIIKDINDLVVNLCSDQYAKEKLGLIPKTLEDPTKIAERLYKLFRDHAHNEDNYNRMRSSGFKTEGNLVAWDESKKDPITKKSIYEGWIAQRLREDQVLPTFERTERRFKEMIVVLQKESETRLVAEGNKTFKENLAKIADHSDIKLLKDDSLSSESKKGILYLQNITTKLENGQTFEDLSQKGGKVTIIIDRVLRDNKADQVTFTLEAKLQETANGKQLQWYVTEENGKPRRILIDNEGACKTKIDKQIEDSTVKFLLKKFSDRNEGEKITFLENISSELFEKRLANVNGKNVQWYDKYQLLSYRIIQDAALDPKKTIPVVYLKKVENVSGKIEYIKEKAEISFTQPIPGKDLPWVMKVVINNKYDDPKTYDPPDKVTAEDSPFKDNPYIKAIYESHKKIVEIAKFDVVRQLEDKSLTGNTARLKGITAKPRDPVTLDNLSDNGGFVDVTLERLNKDNVPSQVTFSIEARVEPDKSLKWYLVGVDGKVLKDKAGKDIEISDSNESREAINKNTPSQYTTLKDIIDQFSKEKDEYAKIKFLKNISKEILKNRVGYSAEYQLMTYKIKEAATPAEIKLAEAEAKKAAEEARKAAEEVTKTPNENTKKAAAEAAKKAEQKREELDPNKRITLTYLKRGTNEKGEAEHKPEKAKISFFQDKKDSLWKMKVEINGTEITDRNEFLKNPFIKQIYDSLNKKNSPPKIPDDEEPRPEGVPPRPRATASLTLPPPISMAT